MSKHWDVIKINKYYMDNSATTPIDADVLKVMVDCYQNCFGNPSSLHRLGLESEKMVKQARQVIASEIGGEPSDIFFTSGGTEANNIALKGAARALKRSGNHIVTTAVEHPAVLDTMQSLREEGFIVDVAGVKQDGTVDLEQLAELLREDTILVSVMHVNNEAGSVNDLAQISAMVHANPNTLLHVDAVQSFAKLPINVKKLKIDLLSMSAHKIHGPKGVGAMYRRKGIRLVPLMQGGGQESGLRPGTENVPGIVGFARACELQAKSRTDFIENCTQIRDVIITAIQEKKVPCSINTCIESSVPYILNISFAGAKGEVMVHMLEEYGIFVSTGSACSSRKKHASHVLKAMGLPQKYLESALRLSFSRFNTPEEACYAVEKLCACADSLRSMGR